MLRLIAARIAHAAAVLVIVTLATTAMLSLAPGDPAASILGQNATPEQIAAVHHQLGLDRPFIEQYLSWAKDALHGDLGTSFFTHQSVWSALAATLPVTLEITLLGLGMALLVASCRSACSLPTRPEETSTGFRARSGPS